MGDDQNCALVGDEVLLQPCDRFGVKVVGRFVQQQHFGRFQQQFAQCYAARFAAGKIIDVRVIRRAAQRFQAHVDLAVEVPEVFCVDLVLQCCHLICGLVRVVHRQLVIAVKDRLFASNAEHHILTHSQRRIQLWFLRKIADSHAFSGPSFPCEVFVHTGHDFHQCGFTGAVHANYPDFYAG